MIHSVYLIYKGMRLVSYHLDKMITNDDDIFTGYLSAVSNFAKDFIGDEVHEILMAQHTIVFDVKNGILLALVLNGKKISKRILSIITKQIHSAFLQEYHEYLTQRIIVPSIFASFTVNIDEIVRDSRLKNMSVTLNSVWVGEIWICH